MTGLFDGVLNPELQMDRMFFKDGHYDLKVIEAKTVTRKRDGKRLVCLQFEVLTSTNNAVPVGAIADHTIRVDMRSDPKDPTRMVVEERVLKDVIRFVASACGLLHTDPSIRDPQSPNFISPQTIDYLFSEANPLAGRLVSLEAESIKTKKNGWFTKHHYNPYVAPESDPLNPAPAQQ